MERLKAPAKIGISLTVEGSERLRGCERLVYYCVGLRYTFEAP